MILNKYIKIW